jgi:hypothetical protein
MQHKVKETHPSVARVAGITATTKKRLDDSDAVSAWAQDQKVVLSNGRVTEHRVSMKLAFVLAGKG